MQRAQLPPKARHTFVLPQYKVVYTSTPKVACTSLKWVLAELAGEDLQRFTDNAPPGFRSAIHQRRWWQRVPTLHSLSDAELAEISGDNGWHVFAVVRHPASRLWSAWQQKVLHRWPNVMAMVPDHLVPPLPRTTADVTDAFARFAVALARGECDDLLEDPHFSPQRRILAPGRMPYTRVYRIEEMDRVMGDLEEQVRRRGGGALPALTSHNETPLKPRREMFTDEVQAAIRAVYRGDFRTWFTDEPAVPPTVIDDAYTAEQLAAAAAAVSTEAVANPR